MRKNIVLVLSLAVILSSSSIVFAGWDPAEEDVDVAKSSSKEADVVEAITQFKIKDPKLDRFFKNAYGYAVFPTVGKGGIGIGGAYGKGLVYEKGNLIGHTSLKQISYGLQLGGQTYSEIVFFKDEAALKTFIQGNYEFGAGVSAVAVTIGASADTDYSNGVAVFTMTKAGLMYEATVSGQKFKFKPYSG